MRKEETEEGREARVKMEGFDMWLEKVKQSKIKKEKGKRWNRGEEEERSVDGRNKQE